MPEKDYNAGREVGIAEGARIAAQRRIWIDVIILAFIVAAVVIITQVSQRGTERLIKATDTRSSDTAKAAFTGCEQRNKIVSRQVQFYREMVVIERGNRFIDDAVRRQRVDAYEETANDITALGVRDCSVYLRIASPSPSTK